MHILRLGATIDEKPTSVDEKSSAVLKYRTPHFRYVITALKRARLLITWNNAVV